jgi:hypothetical protein
VLRILDNLPKVEDDDPREGRFFRRAGQWAGRPLYACPDPLCALSSPNVEIIVKHFRQGHLGEVKGPSILVDEMGRPYGSEN